MFVLRWVLVFLSIVLDSYTAGNPVEPDNRFQAERWLYEPATLSFPLTWHKEVNIFHDMTTAYLRSIAKQFWDSIIAEKDGFALCKTGSSGSCIVAALWIPPTEAVDEKGNTIRDNGRVYLSTIVRGSRRVEMKRVLDYAAGIDDFHPEADNLMAWIRADRTVRKGGEHQYHAEDGCFFNFEYSRHRRYADPRGTQYPRGSRIVSYGTVNGGGVETAGKREPCQQRCQLMAEKLGVAIGEHAIPGGGLSKSKSYLGSWTSDRWDYEMANMN